MLKASLYNKVKPTREETSYPVVIAQPITATRKPPTKSKYRALGGTIASFSRTGVLLSALATLVNWQQSIRPLADAGNSKTSGVGRVGVNSFLSIPIQFQFGAKCELVNSNSIQLI